ncbi:c6 zinc finger domain-containing protein [Stemphylium lycopersici]|uniref:C6 zinc finger domain-containing protein n=1 Tax=Stemphylium lycopersici TaxID=183478 RepID=A0A364N2F4_STELY|nr:c6 zinc finger domain-containing protein [Stemphylium lycopersici]
MSAISRSKLTCAACARRKVKCSKTVPCTNCIRRGQQQTCGIDEPQRDTASPIRSSSSREQELAYLKRRVAQLEDASGQQSPTDTFQSTQPASSPSNMRTQQPMEANKDAASGRDAATVLEFLAWGRTKDPDCHTVASLEPTEEITPQSGATVLDDLSQLSVLQLLLPSPHQVRQLVDYHTECLLWYHGSYFAPTFEAQLRIFLDQHGGIIRNSSVNLQWTALLFAVLTASLTCAPDVRVRSWGFGEPEQETLSRRWFQAIIACLTRADYTSNLSILSCQAIAAATTSAHLLGFSTTQSIHLATAVRIAQSLGIHRLSPDPNGIIVEKEIGRRVWCQLCCQDWFSIPFSESYLVNPMYSTSASPSNCHDEDMVALDPNIPTITSYSRFLREIAAIMPQLQDGLITCNTPYTRYEKVLHWDSVLRSLATRERPLFMTNGPLDPNWPIWISWARHALAITSSHKIIMIHRSFLQDSFENTAFAFTRRTCLAASKTIIKEYKCLIAENGPTLWIHQAFAVAASITLCLDIFYRDSHDSQTIEHRALIQDVLQILHSLRNSTIATRGSKLLEALLAYTSRVVVSQRQKKHSRDGAPVARFDVSNLIREFYESSGTEKQSGLVNDSTFPPLSDDPPPTYDPSESEHIPIDFSQSHCHIPFPPGANSFDDLLYLANFDFANM